MNTIERLSEAAKYAADLSLSGGPYHRLYVFGFGIGVNSRLGDRGADLRFSFLELEECAVNPLIQALDDNAAVLMRAAETEDL